MGFMKFSTMKLRIMIFKSRINEGFKCPDNFRELLSVRAQRGEKKDSSRIYQMALL